MVVGANNEKITKLSIYVYFDRTINALLLPISILNIQFDRIIETTKFIYCSIYAFISKKKLI